MVKNTYEISKSKIQNHNKQPKLKSYTEWNLTSSKLDKTKSSVSKMWLQHKMEKLRIPLKLLLIIVAALFRKLQSKLFLNQGRIQDLIRGGGAQIVTGLKLPFWGLSFGAGASFLVVRGGPGPPGPPPGSAPAEYISKHFYFGLCFGLVVG